MKKKINSCCSPTILKVNKVLRYTPLKQKRLFPLKQKIFVPNNDISPQNVDSLLKGSFNRQLDNVLLLKAKFSQIPPTQS